MHTGAGGAPDTGDQDRNASAPDLLLITISGSPERGNNSRQEAFEREFTLRLGEIESVGGLPLQRPQKSGLIALSLQRDYPQESAFESLLDFSLRKQTPETMRTADGSHQQPEEQPAPP